MGARKLYAEPERLESDGYLGSDLLRYFQGNRVRSGARGRSTAERTMLEMSMGVGMVVVSRHLHRGCRRTELQQKRCPARRHEAGGHVRAKQEHPQQNAGQ